MPCLSAGNSQSSVSSFGVTHLFRPPWNTQNGDAPNSIFFSRPSCNSCIAARNSSHYSFTHSNWYDGFYGEREERHLHPNRASILSKGLNWIALKAFARSSWKEKHGSNHQQGNHEGYATQACKTEIYPQELCFSVVICRYLEYARCKAYIRKHMAGTVSRFHPLRLPDPCLKASDRKIQLF